MRSLRLQENSGFSLIELMVAAGIGVIISLGSAGVLVEALKSSKRSEHITSNTQLTEILRSKIIRPKRVISCDSSFDVVDPARPGENFQVYNPALASTVAGLPIQLNLNSPDRQIDLSNSRSTGYGYIEKLTFANAQSIGIIPSTGERIYVGELKLQSKPSADFRGPPASFVSVGTFALRVSSQNDRILGCVDRNQGSSRSVACNGLASNLVESGEGCALSMNPTRAEGACQDNETYFINDQGLIECKPIMNQASCGEVSVAGAAVSRAAMGMEGGVPLCDGAQPNLNPKSGPEIWMAMCLAKCNDLHTPQAQSPSDSATVSQLPSQNQICRNTCGEELAGMVSINPQVGNIILDAPGADELDPPTTRSLASESNLCVCGQQSIHSGSQCVYCNYGQAIIPSTQNPGIDSLFEGYIRTHYICNAGLLKLLPTNSEYSTTNRCSETGIEVIYAQ